MIIRVFVAIAAVVMAAGLANSDPYLVWPEAADLGETLGVVVSADALTSIAPDAGPLEADKESFVIELTDPSSFVEPVQPRAVIEAPAALGSVMAAQGAGRWTGIVLLFDLPTTWTQSLLTYGTDELSISVSYEGQPIVQGKTVLVMGEGGSSLSAAALEPLREVELEPMLRFRPSWEAASSEGFDPTWPIHAIDFVLRYVKPVAGEVENPSPRVNGDAASALAFVKELAAPSGEKKWKVSLVDPDGFTLEDKGCIAPGDCYSGRWSLVDLVLDKLPGTVPEGMPVFASTDFTIEDVRVYDANGVRLNPAFVGETYFRLHAVNHLVESSVPPPTSAPIRAWPKSAYQGDTFAVLFNTEADASTDPDAAILDASVNNVRVFVGDPDGHSETLVPRAVVELPAALGAKGIGIPPSSLTGVVAFFEVPDPWPNPSPSYSFPASFDVDVEFAGAPTLGSDTISIVGSGGEALSFAGVTDLAGLSPAPMLRLRPVWDEVALEGFDPAWLIGSMEFAVRFSKSGPSDVLDLNAVRNGEAIASLAMADRLPDELTDKLWNVMLIAPDGFTLSDPEIGSPGDSPIGRWSLFDLVLDVDASGVPGVGFEESEFAIESVRVFDLDGVELNPHDTGEPFFDLTLISVPEPGVIPQLLAGSVAVILARQWRRRQTLRG